MGPMNIALWRTILRTLIASSLFILSGPLRLHAQASCDSTENCLRLFTPPPRPYVRKDAAKMTAAEWASFSKGVERMMSITDPSNPLYPLSWQYQANIHGGSSSVTPPPGAPWRCCRHSGWFFLPWHRMELFYFERILRAMSGDDNLIVPYWNYTVPDSDPNWKTKRAIPTPFRTPKVGNPLYVAQRNTIAGPGCGINDGQPLCYDVVSAEKAFPADKSKARFWGPPITPDMLTFAGGVADRHSAFGTKQGQIESQPHNPMHTTVGGKDGLLTSPVGAASDPIFWPIHANIDRAWYCWDKLYNRTGQYPPKNDTNDWWTAPFKFWDVEKTVTKGPDGKDLVTLKAKEVCLTGEQVVQTAVNLRYIYDSCDGLPPFPPGGADAGDTSTAFPDTVEDQAPTLFASVTAQSPVELGAEATTVSFDLPLDVQLAINSVLSATARDGAVVLNIEDIHISKPIGMYYWVYIDLPDEAALDPAGPYYAGNLDFFGVGEHHHDEEVNGETALGDSRSFDITDNVRSLAANGEWSPSKLSVTLSLPVESVTSDCSGGVCPKCPACILRFNPRSPAMVDELVYFGQVSLDVVSWQSNPL